ncbi:hypothetical protein BDN67DRAFT_938418 [Paxillus ammoniavirescens]|nr:hypothetical protein BDN67DRAFT_938418 [Paxillus ammoniavirescens]
MQGSSTNFGTVCPTTQRDRRTSPQPKRVLNKVRNTIANIFARRQAGAAQTSHVRQTVEPVEVAAGRDKTFWVVIAIPTYNAVERILYMIIHCRKPEDPDDDLPATTGTNSSETTAGNAATGNQPEPAGDLVIRTQPQRTEMPAVLGLSGVGNLDRRPESLQTPAGKSITSNQPEHIGMVAFPPAIPQTSPVSPPSHTPRPASSQASSQHDHSPPHVIALSPIEIAMIEEYRRRQAISAFVETAAEPLSSPAHDRGAPHSP